MRISTDIPLDAFRSLKNNISQDIIGQSHVIDLLLIGLLANGNLLLEGLPGLAKTRAIKSLAKNVQSDFGRIQFTPDLLPSDVTGSEIYHNTDEGGQFKFEPGPVFANIVLADEINRAPAKVQAALLEAMEERQVTVGGETHKMPELFMVMATQNPIEQEGTYPLPEAQMDRFLMHITIGYSTKDEEIGIIKLVRGERMTAPSDTQVEKVPPIPQELIFKARKAVDEIFVSPDIEQYMVDLIFATRDGSNISENLNNWIEVGASPRGSLAIDVCARAHAWLNGKNYVTPLNVQAVLPNVLHHRMTLSYEAEAEGVTPNQVIEEIINNVAVP